MIQVIPEIYVKNCRQALDFYSRLFDGQVKNLQMSNDLELFAGYQDKVVHSELHLGNKCTLYFVDIFDETRSRLGNVTVLLHLESRKELERIYTGLTEGGDVSMALQKTFWGAWHAIVTDRFGAPWALNFAQSRPQ